MEKLRQTNIHDFCRTCLLELKHRQKFHLYSMHYRIRSWLLQDDAINSSEDLYPQFICSRCLDKLEDILEFRLMYERSLSTFKDILENAAVNGVIKSKSNTVVKDTNVAEENTDAAAVLNEMEYDCVLISNQPATSNYRQFLENDETTASLSEEPTDFFDFIEADQEIKVNVSSDENKCRSGHFESNGENNSKHSIFHYDQCNRRFGNQDNLDKPTKIHQGLRPFQCPKCDHGFNRLIRLQNHLNEVHAQISITCEYEGCDKVFRRSHKYMRHKRYEHVNGGKLKTTSDQQYKICEELENVTTEISNLNEHQHCRKQEIMKVDVEKFKGEDEVMVLNETIDDSDLLEFDFIPIDRMTLPTHSTYSESSETEEAKITATDSFEYVENTQESIANVKDDDSRSNCSIHINDVDSAEHEVDFIPYDMISVTNNSSGDNRKFSCNQCAKVYMNRQTLDTHIKTHLKTKDIAPYVISSTSRIPAKDNLTETNNIQGVTTAVVKKMQRLTLPCNQCDKVCFSQRTWENHQRTHLGPNTYQCSKSDQSFESLRYMREHLNKVHSNKNIICKYEGCNRLFQRSESYTYFRHCRDDHGPKAKKEATMPQQHQKLRELSVKLSRLKEHQIQGTVKSLKEKREILEEETGDNSDMLEFDVMSVDRKSTEISQSHHGGKMEHTTAYHSEYQQNNDNENTEERISRIKGDEDNLEENDKCPPTDTAVQKFSTDSDTDKMPLASKTPRKYGYQYRCDQCNKRCLNQQTLNNHMRIHQGLKPSQCPKCNRCFHSPGYLRVHLNEFHKKITIKCEYEGCGKEFHRTCTYRHHKRHKHMFVDQPKPKPRKNPQQAQHICEECGKVYSQLHSLQAHQYSHRPKEEYPFHCSECGGAFASRERLKRHQVTHREKIYECPHCGLKKRNIYELKMHINYHTRELKFPCPKCPKVFNDSVNLGRHDKVAHLGLRPYACRYCDQKFAVSQTWKHHEMRHTGEKPHECPVCGLRFIQPCSMKRHIKRQHSEKKPAPPVGGKQKRKRKT